MIGRKLNIKRLFNRNKNPKNMINESLAMGIMHVEIEDDPECFSIYNDILKSKSKEDLLKIIDDFDYMNETAVAIDLLSEIDSEKALEKGLNFLRDDNGDEYFQAMLIDTLDFIDFHKVLECLTNRKDEIQPYLLGELMNEMFMYSSKEYVECYVDIVNKKYMLLDQDEKKKLSEHYKRFANEFKIDTK